MYLFFVFFCIISIIAINLILNFSSLTVLWLFISFASVLLPSLFVAIIIRLLPQSWFDYNKKVYHVSEKEKNFLVKLGVRKWKNKIPDLGSTVNFKKNELKNSKNTEYLKKFIQETCYGEMLHIFCIISALVSLLFVSRNIFLTMALPIAIIYSMINIPSILIQRYNRPRLIKQLKRLERNRIVLDETKLEKDVCDEEIKQQNV